MASYEKFSAHLNLIPESYKLDLGFSPRSLQLRTVADHHLTDKQQLNGWHKVENEKHVFAHRILSHVIYRSLEPPNREKNEVVFAAPDPQDIIYLLWSDTRAVGFCTLKPKGSPFGELHEQYALTTLDTIFVRSSHRRRGHVSALLHNLASQCGDVGFSQPISDAMLKVLTNFLTANKQYRRTFWEVTGSGQEGNRKLIWFQLRRLIQAQHKPSLEQSPCRAPALTSGVQS